MSYGDGFQLNGQTPPPEEPETRGNQGTTSKIVHVSGKEAGGRNDRNDGGIEIHNSSGGTKTLKRAVLIKHNGDVDIAGGVTASNITGGDFIFRKNDQPLWRMFEDEHGLYVENIPTQKKYRFALELMS